VTDEVEGTAVVSVLTEFLLKLLDPVLTAEIDTGGNCLPHPLCVIHFGSCQELDLILTASGLRSGQGHLFADPGNIICNFTHFAYSLSGENAA
jgi:hypothetical protein